MMTAVKTPLPRSSDRVMTSVTRKSNPTISDIPPGYVTGDEFKRRVMEGLERKLRDYGYLE